MRGNVQNITETPGETLGRNWTMFVQRRRPASDGSQDGRNFDAPVVPLLEKREPSSAARNAESVSTLSALSSIATRR